MSPQATASGLLIGLLGVVCLACTLPPLLRGRRTASGPRQVWFGRAIPTRQLVLGGSALLSAVLLLQAAAVLLRADLLSLLAAAVAIFAAAELVAVAIRQLRGEPPPE